MEKHKGQIVEYAVRMNGYSITELSTQLGVNRRSLYYWFQTEQLRPDIILQIGLIIRRDFSHDFPDLFVKEDFAPKPVIKSVQEMEEELAYKDKYIKLLEKYNDLMLELSSSPNEVNNPVVDPCLENPVLFN